MTHVPADDDVTTVAEGDPGVQPTAAPPGPEVTPAEPDRRYRGRAASAPDVPLVGGMHDPASQTLADGNHALAAWPGSLLARIGFGRRVVRGAASVAERDHRLRQVTIAAGRDIGANADEFLGDDGRVHVEAPPHRGIGRLRFTEQVERTMPAFSRALTDDVNAQDRVQVATDRARGAREDLEQAREAMPAVPAGGMRTGWLWIPLIVLLAVIEGVATKQLWVEVVGDTRAGVPLAAAFAFVFAGCVHVCSVWFWNIADAFGRRRQATMALVTATMLSVVGLLWVLGVERDDVLISNRVAQEMSDRADAAAIANADAASAAAVAARNAAEQGAPAGGGNGGGSGGASQAPAPAAAPTGGGSGLLGALGGTGATAGAGGGAGATAAAGASAPSGTATDGSGLLAATGGTSSSTGGTSSAPEPEAASPTPSDLVSDDVSFKFVVWLSFVVFFVMILAASSHELGAPYRRARKQLKKLEARDEKARAELQAAETHRQDASARIDASHRILEPLAERAYADEQLLDRLFIDQVERSAIAAGFGRLEVAIQTPPAQHTDILLSWLEPTDLRLRPIGVDFNTVNYDHESTVDELAAERRFVVDPHGPNPLVDAPGTGEAPDEQSDRPPRTVTLLRRLAELRDRRRQRREQPTEGPWWQNRPGQTYGPPSPDPRDVVTGGLRDLVDLPPDPPAPPAAPQPSPDSAPTAGAPERVDGDPFDPGEFVGAANGASASPYPRDQE